MMSGPGRRLCGNSARHFEEASVKLSFGLSYLQWFVQGKTLGPLLVLNPQAGTAAAVSLPPNASASLAGIRGPSFGTALPN
jgi:hypothetical protein